MTLRLGNLALYIRFEIIADLASAAGKFDKMAQLNFDAIGREVQVACGDGWLQNTNGQAGYEGELDPGEIARWDGIHGVWRRLRATVETCEVNGVLGWTLSTPGSGIPDIVIICERALEKPSQIQGSDLDYVIRNSLSAILFHEMLHTDILGKCTSTQPEHSPCDFEFRSFTDYSQWSISTCSNTEPKHIGLSSVIFSQRDTLTLPS